MPRINKAGLVLALALSVAPIALIPAPASAQLAVVDVRSIAQLTQQVAKQAQQLQYQIQQYQNMVTNTTKLPSQVWGNTMQSIQSINSLMQQATTISSQSANLAAQMQAKFPGFSSYGGQNISMPSKYAEWSNDTRSSVQSTLQALGLQNSQMNSEEALMQQLQAMGNTAQGRMQGQEIANQFAAQAVRQMQELRQLIVLQTQMQAAQMQRLQDKLDLQAANGAKAYTKSNYAVTGGKAY